MNLVACSFAVIVYEMHVCMVLHVSFTRLYCSLPDKYFGIRRTFSFLVTYGNNRITCIVVSNSKLAMSFVKTASGSWIE